MIAAARAGLFGLLFVLQKREVRPSVRLHQGCGGKKGVTYGPLSVSQTYEVVGLSFYVGQLLEFLQMMLFVLYKVFVPAWGPSRQSVQSMFPVVLSPISARRFRMVEHNRSS